jgi:hypothetical protein
MKKRLIVLTLVAALLCSLGGWVYAAGEGDLSAPDQETFFVPGDVPAESGSLDGMVPPINALVLCMLEQGLTYDEDSDIFFWNSLYYMISLYGELDIRAELTDDTLILPTETVEDYAAALFTNYSGLPALPNELLDRVTFDWQSDSYRLARGDAGLSETRIDGVEQLSNGQVRVTGALVALEDESDLCTFSAILTANDSMFGYSISGMELQ